MGKSLCLSCGICCNGVLFQDVELQTGDDAARLQSLGLRLKNPRGRQGGANPKFPQPCAALDGCRCRIYADRPTYCRQFECLLFRRVRAGEVGIQTVVRVIQTARRRVDQVLKLLRQLGDTDEHLNLARRFKLTRRRLENAIHDPQDAMLLAELTQAVHRLNLLLRESFYPSADD